MRLVKAWFAAAEERRAEAAEGLARATDVRGRRHGCLGRRAEEHVVKLCGVGNQ